MHSIESLGYHRLMKQPAPADMRTLVAACAAITVFGFAFGMTYPLLSLILESRGVSSDMIGINSAMMPIGILLFSQVIPFAAKRFGARRVAIAAALVSAAIALGYKVFDNLPAWFLLRLVQGMSISTLFVLSESWIVGSAGDRNRGKIVAIYSAILAASFGAGPLLISFIGIEGWLPFVIGAVVLALGAVPFVFVREHSDADPEETPPSSILSFAPRAPLLIAAVGVMAIFDAATLSLIPVYGMKIGFDVSTSANLLTAMVLGNTVLQFPIGWMADRYSHRALIAGLAVVTVICLALLPAAGSGWAIWPLLVVLGTTGYGVYTVSLTSLGNRFSGTELVSGSASFAVMFGLGALFGSVSGGWAMTGFGPHGLPYMLALAYLLLTIGVIQRQFMLKRQES